MAPGLVIQFSQRGTVFQATSEQNVVVVGSVRFPVEVDEARTL